MSRARFGPKGAVLGIVAPERPTGREFVALCLASLEARSSTSTERWRAIEGLLNEEGYELVRDLFEHQIKRRQ